MAEKTIQFPADRWKGPKKPEEEKTPEMPPVEAEKVEFDLGKYTEMILAMSSLWPQVSNRTGLIKDRGELVATYTDNQIVTIMNQSSLADWETRPVFFQSMLNEIQKRNLGGVNRFRPDR